MARGLERVCVGVQPRQSQAQDVGNDWPGGQVLDCAGLEGQPKDCGRLDKAMWSRFGACLHEQVCPLGRLVVGHVEDG